MTYTRYKIIELMVCVVLVGNILADLAFGKSLFVLISSSAIILAVWVVVMLTRRGKFPQWKGLVWNISWKLMVTLLIAATALIVVSEMYDLRFGNLYLSSAAIFLGAFCYPIYEVWCAIKYEMDKFGSVDEMVKAHPEAEQKIQKRAV